jgi:hypothetical protein
MAQERFTAELEETKAEVERLRNKLSAGAPTIHKDLSLISLVPKWSGSETTVTLEEFISSIEGSAKIGKWEDSDCLQIATLKLTDQARSFFNGCAELRAEDATWQSFKNVFRQRFRDVHTDQFHFMRLQTARQGKNEDPQGFADRCRALAQKIVQKSDDPQAQRIHKENAERMLLTIFVAGLHGAPGRQVSYANPQTMKQALTIALSVQEAEKQERFNESFNANFEKSVRLTTRSPNRASSERDSFSRSGDTDTGSRMCGQHRMPVRGDRKSFAPESTRNAQTKANI